MPSRYALSAAAMASGEASFARPSVAVSAMHKIPSSIVFIAIRLRILFSPQKAQKAQKLDCLHLFELLSHLYPACVFLQVLKLYAYDTQKKTKAQEGTIRHKKQKSGALKELPLFCRAGCTLKSFPSPLTKECARQPAQNQAAMGCASALRRASNLAFIF